MGSIGGSNRRPIDFSNMRMNSSSLLNRKPATKTNKAPAGAPPIVNRIKPIPNPYASRIAENDKKIAQMREQMSSMGSRPAAVAPSAPSEPDYLTMSNINFDKVSDLLGQAAEGQGYVYRDGKWQKINLNSIGEPDFTVGYSYKGNDLLQGREKLDQEYQKYLDAVDKAKEKAKQIINEDKANALLRGVKYESNEDDMNKLIKEQFSKIWSPEKQDKIQGMVLEFGEPTNFKGFSLKPEKVDQTTDNPNAPAANSRLSLVGGSRGGMSGDDTLIQPTGRLKQFLGGRRSLLGD
jgi:hypothetical protein